jgi:hypothetical protein
MVRGLLVIAFICISFGAAYWVGTAARSRNQSQESEVVIAGLEVARADLEAGEIWEQKDFVWRLPIRNRTEHSIEVRDIQTSCGCFAIEPRSLSIPPGETAALKLTIDLTNRTPAEYGVDRRPFALSIRPITVGDIPSRGVVWKLTGTVRSRVTLDVQNVHFGEQPVRGQAAVTRCVQAKTHVPCQRLEVTVEPAIAKATVKAREEKGILEILISPNPDLPAGPFQATARIDVVAPTGERFSGTALPIAGTMQREVRLLPARVLLDPTPVGETAEAVVTVQAPAEAKVVVDHFETDSLGLRVEAVAIPGVPAHRAFRIRQRVDSEGDGTSAISFVLRGADGKTSKQVIEICYRGEPVKKAPSRNPEGRQP